VVLAPAASSAAAVSDSSYWFPTVALIVTIAATCSPPDKTKGSKGGSGAFHLTHRRVRASVASDEQKAKAQREAEGARGGGAHTRGSSARTAFSDSISSTETIWLYCVRNCSLASAVASDADAFTASAAENCMVWRRTCASRGHSQSCELHSLKVSAEQGR
jgi:hypothetical protein